jgi:hypothetical protein
LRGLGIAGGEWVGEEQPGSGKRREGEDCAGWGLQEERGWEKSNLAVAKEERVGVVQPEDCRRREGASLGSPTRVRNNVSLSPVPEMLQKKLAGAFEDEKRN